MNEFDLVKTSTDLILMGSIKSVIIKSKKGHRLALDRIDIISNAKPNTKEFEELRILGEAVRKYEEKHH